MNLTSPNFISECIFDYFLDFILSEKKDSFVFNRLNWVFLMCEAQGVEKFDKFPFKKSVEDIRRRFAVEFFNEKCLYDYHNVLLGGRISSVFRREKSYSLAAHGKGRYYFLPPGDIERCMASFIKCVNFCSSVKDISKLYSDFTNIHPFEDGNGRFVRILVDCLLKKAGLNIINPYLYFANQLHDSESSGLIVTERNAFNAISWAELVSSEVANIIKDYIQEKISGFHMEGRLACEVYLSMDILVNNYGYSRHEAANLISRFCSSGSYFLINLGGDVFAINLSILELLKSVDSLLIMR